MFAVFYWKKVKKTHHIPNLNTYSAGDQCSCETVLLYEPQKSCKGAYMITPPPKKPIKQSTFNTSSFKGGGGEKMKITTLI